MAAVLKDEFSLESILKGGAKGELSVWFAGKKACEKTYNGFPADTEMIALVRPLVEA